ncbi:hypothetical protein [Roseiconus lacunae]|uniref:hypothetical protein n=1 Tax=Roseiconus lacunae TaxID=2605694 RepID=UPI001E4D7B73|nr:hypothetical protein [Roseiconus lacunae]MCD0459136.1 hypothetical protein [Roseiconus lacunae]
MRDLQAVSRRRLASATAAGKIDVEELQRDLHLHQGKLPERLGIMEIGQERN